jgi:hypothetical protein
VQLEFSLLVAQAQLCLQELREQVVVPVAPAFVIERHEEQSACLDVSKPSVRIGWPVIAWHARASSSRSTDVARRKSVTSVGLLVQDLRGQVVGEIAVG